MGLVRDVYFFLLQQGELVRVSENIVLSPDRITFLTTQLKESFPSGHTFTVPEFKDLFRDQPQICDSLPGVPGSQTNHATYG